MVSTPRKDPSEMSALHRYYYKTHTAIHFEKGYNFPLFIICVGALMGFVLARFMYLDINGIFTQDAIPSDMIHWAHSGTHRTGIIIHLATILPAGFLVCFQFVPIIRHKILLFHRLNGYVVITLFLVSIASVGMLFPDIAGGSPSTQVGIGVLAASTTITILLAYINIKRLQIDQHRAFMIRTWVYSGSIISLRLIMMAMNLTIDEHYPDRYHWIFSCNEIFQMYAVSGGVPPSHNPTPLLYPACAANPQSSTTLIPVRASTTASAGPENASAMRAYTFGAALWLAFTLHVMGAEIYLRMTPAEGQRLREVSYVRQMEKGLKPVGRAGYTSDRFGDAGRWVPNKQRDAPVENGAGVGEKKRRVGSGGEDESDRTLGRNSE